MTSLSELQQQGLSSLHQADAFPGVLLFTGFYPSFPEEQMLPSAASEAHDNLIAQQCSVPRALNSRIALAQNLCLFKDLRFLQHKAVLKLMGLLENRSNTIIFRT